MKHHISVEHKEGGQVELTIIDGAGEGTVTLLDNKAKYDLADMLLNPNGSGIMRNFGRKTFAEMTPEEKRERDAALKRTAERMAAAGVNKEDL